MSRMQEPQNSLIHHATWLAPVIPDITAVQEISLACTDGLVHHFIHGTHPPVMALVNINC